MLIGICGKAGAGKDTIADYFIKNFKFQRISLADPIKRLVKDVFVLDDHTVYDREAREQPLKNWPDWSVRKLLQYIGTELFREKIDDAIWVKSLWYRIQQNRDNDYVTSDLRFPNERQYFKDNAKEGEFFCIKVVRPGYDGKVGLVGHASEAYDLKGDIEIVNDGTIEELYNRLDKIVANLLLNKIIATKKRCEV
jgi:hypothetical protein